VTCLVVSHRRAALERADQVLVMDGGAHRRPRAPRRGAAHLGALAELWGEARGDALVA
jgi:ABC-type transport system involved in cytochrome bd biosynthesis fused ATPase/permease subunit